MVDGDVEVSVVCRVDNLLVLKPLHLQKQTNKGNQECESEKENCELGGNRNAFFFLKKEDVKGDIRQFDVIKLYQKSK